MEEDSPPHAPAGGDRDAGNMKADALVQTGNQIPKRTRQRWVFSIIMLGVIAFVSILEVLRSPQSIEVHGEPPACWGAHGEHCMSAPMHAGTGEDPVGNE